MVYRRCSCSAACRHWSIQVKVGGEVERGPATKYAKLLEPGQNLPTTKQEARDLEAAVRTWVLRGRPEVVIAVAEEPSPSAQDGAETTIGTALEVYIPKRVKRLKSHATQEGNVRRMAIAIGVERPIAAMLNRDAVEDYLAELEEALTGATANRYRTRWSNFINFCRDRYGLEGRSPFFHQSINPDGLRKYPEGHRTRRIEPEEEAAIVKACQALDDGGMMLGRFYCALDTGVRRGEMLALRREDIIRNKQTGGLVLRARWETTKSQKERLVPVTSDRLIEFLETRRFAAFTFGQHDGTRLDGFRIDWENVMLAAGVIEGRYCKPGHWIFTTPDERRIHWHDLRHECASRLAEGTSTMTPVPLAEIKELLGHASIETTQRYLNTTLKSLAANMRRVHQSLGI